MPWAPRVAGDLAPSVVQLHSADYRNPGFAPSVVVWSTGYRRHYSWIDIPGALDARSLPIHRRGISPIPGLGYAGLPWQHTRGSALLGSVGRDAEYLVARLSELPFSGRTLATSASYQ